VDDGQLLAILGWKPPVGLGDEVVEPSQRQRERGAELVGHVAEEGGLGAVELCQRLGTPPLLLVGPDVADCRGCLRGGGELR